jgi:hypothetical protein
MSTSRRPLGTGPAASDVDQINHVVRMTAAELAAAAAAVVADHDAHRPGPGGPVSPATSTRRPLGEGPR